MSAAAAFLAAGLLMLTIGLRTLRTMAASERDLAAPVALALVIVGALMTTYNGALVILGWWT